MCLSSWESQLSCRETQLLSSLPPSKITHSRNLVELVLPAPEALTTRHATASHGPKRMTRDFCLPAKQLTNQCHTEPFRCFLLLVCPSPGVYPSSLSFRPQFLPSMSMSISSSPVPCPLAPTPYHNIHAAPISHPLLHSDRHPHNLSCAQYHIRTRDSTLVT